MTIQDEIDAMLKMYTDAPGTEAPGTESVQTEPPGTESPGTEPPSTKAPTTPTPNTSAPTTPAPTTEPPEEDEVTMLRRQVDELSAKVGQRPEGQTQAPKTKVPTTQPPLEDVDFLGDVDPYDLTQDPKKLNSLLNQIYRKSIETSQQRVPQHVFRHIPDIVKHNVVVQSNIQEKSKRFYEENEDLAGFKKAVALTAEEVMSEHPEWDLETVYKETGERARKKLGLYKQTQQKTQHKQKGPSFPKSKRGSRNRQPSKPNVDPLLDEIDEMNKL